MKQVTATEARRQFFKLLDSAARGEKVVIKRNGVPLEIVRQSRKPGKAKASATPWSLATWRMLLP